MKRRAFTLIELLVTIGIITLLIGLVFAAFTATRRQANRKATEATLQAIHAGMNAYLLDHHNIPLPLPAPGLATAPDRPNPPTGGQVIVQAMLGLAPAVEASAPSNMRPKQDGKDGPGFKVRPGATQTYGPYIEPAKVRTSNTGEPLLAEFLDSWDMPIQYEPEVKRDGAGNPILTPAGDMIYTQHYMLISAGEDKKFGTPDDIRSSQ